MGTPTINRIVAALERADMLCKNVLPKFPGSPGLPAADLRLIAEVSAEITAALEPFRKRKKPGNPLGPRMREVLKIACRLGSVNTEHDRPSQQAAALKLNYRRFLTRDRQNSHLWHVTDAGRQFYNRHKDI